MRRRTIGLIATFLLGALAGALPSGAQQPKKVPRIGYLSLGAGPRPFDETFRQTLHDLGWIEGQNIAIEYRWAAGERERYPALAEELVRLKVDVIVSGAGAAGTRVLKEATSTIPIVMATVANAVENGLVASLDRPGGNITGISQQYAEVHTKLLELLHETLPHVTQVAFLWNSTSPTYARTYEKAQAVAPGLGLTIQSLALRHPKEIESVLEKAAQQRAGALVVMGRMYTTFRRQIPEFAVKNRTPVFSISADNVERHFGLLAYQWDTSDNYRRAAIYVDKILRGAKPAELPVQRPRKFDLVVNLKTAKALGITIPPSILYRANTVIK